MNNDKQKSTLFDVQFRQRDTVGDGVKVYQGPYEVTPSDEEQVLNTGRKMMKGNVLVRAVAKATINEVPVEGNKLGSEYSLQDLLIAGENIEIEDNGDHTATIRVVGMGSGELATDLVVSNPIGRYAMDETIPEGTGFEDIFRGLLSKTYYPTLTPPSVSMAYDVPALVEIGAAAGGSSLTLNFNRGSINPQYGADNPYRAGEATTYGIRLRIPGAEDYTASGTDNVFSWTPVFMLAVPGIVTMTGTAYYVEGTQPKDSDGHDYDAPLPAGNVSTSKSVEFIMPFYYGKNAAASIGSLSGFTKDVSKKGQKHYAYANADNEYLYIVYDASYGNLKSILDENNFENLDSWVKMQLIDTSFGVENVYNVYRSGFAVTGNASFTFKF